MMATMKEYLDDAKSEALQRFKDNAGHMNHNMIVEAATSIADSGTPVYYGTLLELASDDTSLASEKPELGPAFDGEPTAVNIIAANIYERLYQVACETLNEAQRTANYCWDCGDWLSDEIIECDECGAFLCSDCGKSECPDCGCEIGLAEADTGNADKESEK